MLPLLADGSDYLDRTIPAVSISASAANGLPREICTFVRIFDDDDYEDIEDFDLLLELDPLTMQSGIILRPDISTVCIRDNDGKHIKYFALASSQKFCGTFEHSLCRACD